MNEIDIIKGCLKNNRESQKALYDSFYNKMLGVCLRFSKDADEAKEILHEGFSKIFANINNFKEDDSFEEWIKEMMIIASIGYLDKNKQNIIVSTFDANKIAVNSLPEISDDELISTIDKDGILKAVQGLTPAYRKVFNLFVVDGYSHREIAGMLDISEETSESNLSKAKFNLRKNLQQIIKNSDGKEKA